jgi:hypothetical protein
MRRPSKNIPAVQVEEDFSLVPYHGAETAIALPQVLGEETSRSLQRMFRDPRTLEDFERRDLVMQLRKAVELAPHVPEVRVLLGMALSVDLQAQEALETLREAAKQSPDCFIARLKFGELLMRLRACRQAEVETHQAALLAVNAAQSEMARRQAAVIRTMLREGVERGGYGGLLSRLLRLRRNRNKVEQNSTPVLIAAK